MEISNIHKAQKEIIGYFEKIFGKNFFKVLRYLSIIVIISDIMLFIIYWENAAIRKTLLGIHLPFALLLIISTIDYWIFNQEYE